MNDTVPPGSTGTHSFIENPQDLRISDAKVTEYLLNCNHPQGAPKARFFEAVGHSRHELDRFKATMRAHAATNPVASVESHDFGKKHVIDCFVRMPNGRCYCIRTVWNDHLDGMPPILITAHPVDAA